MKTCLSVMTFSIALLVMIVDSTARKSPEPMTPRAAASEGLSLLQPLGSRFIEHSGCVSCHNNTLPALAAAVARERGFKVDEIAVTKERELALDLWRKRRDGVLQNDPFPGGVDTTSYVLMGLAASGQEPDQTTDAMVNYLMGLQTKAGNWEIALKSRPPIESTDFNATAFSMRAIQLYAPKGRAEELGRRVALARKWLELTPARTNEDRVFKLLGLKWSGAGGKVIQKAADELLTAQRPDGGWSQIPTMDSDSYATGQALVALNRAGGVAADGPAYKRGVQFLMSTRKDDGSWYVRSRSFPFQKQFNGGFPYGKDQWISAAGSSWAVMALALTVGQPATSVRAPI